MAANAHRTKTFQQTTKTTSRSADDETCCCCIPIIVGAKLIAVWVIAMSLFSLMNNIYVIAHPNPPEEKSFSLDYALYKKYGKTTVYIDLASDLCAIILSIVILYGIYTKNQCWFILPCLYIGVEVLGRMFIIANWCIYADEYLHSGGFLDVPTNRRTQAVIIISS
ncbi:hypothetical protein M3Y98_00745600 [Aphelenchoides besseyi]|nr:hypothetical protein M3Y98_00745600 [Aphelenchoides besseyi]